MTISVPSMRRGVLAPVLVVLAMVAALTCAAPAWAHSAAVGSSPADGASIDRSPETVTVTFNEDLRPAFAELKVVGPDGNFWQRGEPTVEGRTVSVPVGELGPAGEYKVNYRVTSADGHPVQGQRVFTLTVAGSGQPGAAATQSDVDGPADDHGFPVWAIVLIVLAVLLVLAVVAAVLLRRRTPRER